MNQSGARGSSNVRRDEQTLRVFAEEKKRLIFCIHKNKNETTPYFLFLSHLTLLSRLNTIPLSLIVSPSAHLYASNAPSPFVSLSYFITFSCFCFRPTSADCRGNRINGPYILLVSSLLRSCSVPEFVCSRFFICSCLPLSRDQWRRVYRLHSADETGKNGTAEFQAI
jgi:hypothetical protein